MSSRQKLIFALCVVLQVMVIVIMVTRKQAVIAFGKQIVLKTNPVDPHSLFRGDYARIRTAIHTPEISNWRPWPPKRGATVFTELTPSGTSWNLVTVHQAMPDHLPATNVVLRGKVRSHTQWSGQPIFNLVDVSSPGWLNTQPDDPDWQRSWGASGQLNHLYHRGNRLPEGATVYVSLFSSDGRHWNLQGTDADSTRLAKRHYQWGGFITLKGRAGPYEEKKMLNVEYGIESYFVPEGKGRHYERSGLNVEVAVSRSGHAVVKKVILP